MYGIVSVVQCSARLANVTVHNIFRDLVKFGTEHKVFCQKFNMLSQFNAFWGVKVWGNAGNITFRVLQ